MSTPLHRAAAFGVALLIGSVGLAACGDDSDSGGSDGGDGGKTDVTAACSLDSPPTSAASAPAASGTGGKASGKVGVILPDTTSSTRYELYDKPLLEQGAQRRRHHRRRPERPGRQEQVRLDRAEHDR